MTTVPMKTVSDDETATDTRSTADGPRELAEQVRPWGTTATSSAERRLALENFRRHPVVVVLEYAALGELPDRRKLDALGLPDAVRRKVVDLAALIAKTKAAGQNADAKAQAWEAAEEVFAELPEELQDAGHWDEPEPDITDPGELAERVPRL